MSLLSSVEPKSPLADGVGMNEDRASVSTMPPAWLEGEVEDHGFSFFSGLAYSATCRSISR